MIFNKIKYDTALKKAAIGSGNTHDNKMFFKTVKLVFFVAKPMPKREPTETCVVETGSPEKLAVDTKTPVTKLAAKPCSLLRGVIFLPSFPPLLPH